MSLHRENITWQSPDGTWNLGFYTFYRTLGDDPEWDVEYDTNSFWWASTGHPSRQSADNSWQGANPGGGWVVHNTPENTERVAALDRMASAYLTSEANRHQDNRGGWR